MTIMTERLRVGPSKARSSQLTNFSRFSFRYMFMIYTSCMVCATFERFQRAWETIIRDGLLLAVPNSKPNEKDPRWFEAQLYCYDHKTASAWMYRRRSCDNLPWIITIIMIIMIMNPLHCRGLVWGVIPSPQPQALPQPVGRRGLSTPEGVNHRGGTMGRYTKQFQKTQPDRRLSIAAPTI